VNHHLLTHRRAARICGQIAVGASSTLGLAAATVPLGSASTTTINATRLAARRFTPIPGRAATQAGTAHGSPTTRVATADRRCISQIILKFIARAANVARNTLVARTLA
jgi:hypothetical protein